MHAAGAHPLALTSTRSSAFAAERVGDCIVQSVDSDERQSAASFRKVCNASPRVSVGILDLAAVKRLTSVIAACNVDLAVDDNS